LPAAKTWSAFKKMEGQHNLVGPQRPSTRDQLFASLPKNLIFSDARIKIGSCTVGPSIFSRPSKAAARHPNSEVEPVEWADENANARARRNIAIPAHFNWSEWLRWPGSPGRIPRNTKRDSNAATGDRSVIASARLVARGWTTAPRVLTIWIVRAWHWLNHAVASSAERG
jgi:hypothetical protein